MSQRMTIIKQKQQPVLTVFLDVDGVLNTRTTCQRTPDGYTGVDDARVEILSKAVKAYGDAEIVLSSDWKEMKDTDSDHNIGQNIVELMDGLKEFTGIEMDYMEFKKYCLRRMGF